MCLVGNVLTRIFFSECFQYDLSWRNLKWFNPPPKKLLLHSWTPHLGSNNIINTEIFTELKHSNLKCKDSSYFLCLLFQIFWNNDMPGIDSNLYFLIGNFLMLWSHLAPAGSENELGDLTLHLLGSFSLPSESPRFLKHVPLAQTSSFVTIFAVHSPEGYGWHIRGHRGHSWYPREHFVSGIETIPWYIFADVHHNPIEHCCTEIKTVAHSRHFLKNVSFSLLKRIYVEDNTLTL